MRPFDKVAIIGGTGILFGCAAIQMTQEAEVERMQIEKERALGYDREAERFNRLFADISGDAERVMNRHDMDAIRQLGSSPKKVKDPAWKRSIQALTNVKPPQLPTP